MRPILLIVVSASLIVACKKNPEPAPPPAPSVGTPPASASAALTTAHAPFEGEIVMNVKDESNQKLPSAITYDVKGDNVRYSAQAVSVHAIDNRATHVAYAVDDGKKAFEQFSTTAATTTKAPAAPKVTKTGKMDKVAGIDCENWTIEGGTEKVDVCAAKSVAFFDLARDAKDGAAEPAWATALTDADAFPLRVVVRDMKGNEEYRAEASTANAKKLDDSLFSLPTGDSKSTTLDTKRASLP